MKAPPAPQQGRAVRTRQALVDAAVACLAQHGLAGSSTVAVAKRAGVSQGALFRHFPTKTHLLTAAAQAVLASLVERFVVAVQHTPVVDGEDRLKVGMRSLWTVFTDPALYGVYELFLAARTDPVLQAALDPVLEAHAQTELELARRLFPEAAASRPDFDLLVPGLLTTLRGAAVGVAARPSADAPAELAVLVALARAELGLPAALKDV